MRTFMAVAAELIYSRAAQRLHLTQRAVSQQIRQLEKDVGVGLVDRSARAGGAGKGWYKEGDGTARYRDGKMWTHHTTSVRVARELVQRLSTKTTRASAATSRIQRLSKPCANQLPIPKLRWQRPPRCLPSHQCPRRAGTRRERRESSATGMGSRGREKPGPTQAASPDKTSHGAGPSVKAIGIRSSTSTSATLSSWLGTSRPV